MTDNNRPIKLAIGLMSGTSLDGIDAALIKSDGETTERFGQAFHMDYSSDMRSRLKTALSEAKTEKKPTDKNSLINETEQVLSDLHYVVVRELLELNALKPGDIDVVGFHGQTLLHGPDQGWTWQIGSGERLAARLGITVVNDLRRYDVEHGGQGAPLAPVYHQSILKGKGKEYPAALINIGGVSNITWVGSEKTGDMVAFDAGPGNALLDDWVREKTELPYDIDGMISIKGKADQEMVNRWMENDYFNLSPPKSLDRDDFDVSEVSALSLEDGAASLCAFTVATIKAGAEKCPVRVKNWYVCGGGAHNPVIMKMLKYALDGDVNTVRSLGFDGDYIEAEAFAYLAVRKLYDLPITFPGTTGISEPSSGGVINNP